LTDCGAAAAKPATESAAKSVEVYIVVDEGFGFSFFFG
jgi:hypothetical protein